MKGDGHNQSNQSSASCSRSDTSWSGTLGKQILDLFGLVEKTSVKFSSWQDVDKHPPMAKIKPQGMEKKEKNTMTNEEKEE